MKISWAVLKLQSGRDFVLETATYKVRKIYYFQFQRALTPKIRTPELRFLQLHASHVALHLCKVSWKYLKRILSYRADTILWQRHDFVTNLEIKNPWH